MHAKDLLGFLLPLIRLEDRRRRRFAALSATGLLVGRWKAGRGDASPEMFAADPSDEAVERLIRAGGSKRLAAFRWEDIHALGVSPVDRSPHCRLVVQAESGRWSGVIPVGTQSLLVEALGARWGRTVQVGPLRAGAARYAKRAVFCGLAGLLTLLAIWIVATERGGDQLAGLLLAIPAVLFGLIGVLTWKPRTLPVKSAKPASPRPKVAVRRPSSPALGVALRLAGAAAIVAAYAGSGWLLNHLLRRSHDESASALIMFFNTVAQLLLFAPGVWLITRGYVLSQPDGSTLLARDPRPPVLYLRSFGDDDKHTFTEESWCARLCGLITPKELDKSGRVLRYINPLGAMQSVLRLPLRMLCLVLGRGSDTAEEQLARALRHVGPVVAVGNPSEAFPTPGAARVYLEHHEWQERVLELAQRSALVVLQPTDTDGVWWEVRSVLKTLPPRRILICFRAVHDQDLRDRCLARLGQLLGRRMPPEAHQALFLAFNDDWSVRPLPVVDSNPFAWPWTGVTADLRRTLAGVVSRLGGRDDVVPAPPAPSRPTLLNLHGNAKVLAGFAYGLLPIALASLALLSPLLVNSYNPALSNVMKPVAGVGYAMRIDSAWKFDGHPEGVESRDRYSLGLNKVLFVASEPRTSENGLKFYLPEAFESLAKTTLGGPGTVTRSTGLMRDDLGGWPWRTGVYELARGDGALHTKVQVWVLEASRRRFIVLCNHTFVTVGLTAGADLKWDDAIFASVRSGLREFEIPESTYSVDDAPLSPAAVSLGGGSYALRPAKDAVESPPLYQPYERSFLFGQDHEISVLRSKFDQVEDPVRFVQYIGSLAKDQFPELSISIQEVGWIKLNGRTLLHIRRTLDRPNTPTTFAESLDFWPGQSDVFEALLQTASSDAAARDRAHAALFAMAASVQFNPAPGSPDLSRLKIPAPSILELTSPHGVTPGK